MVVAFGLLATVMVVVRFMRRSMRRAKASPADSARETLCSGRDHNSTKIIPATIPESHDLVISLRQELSALKHAREEERKGRINAERALRKMSQTQSERDGYVLQSIGIVHSCFPDRRGTPRQPTLCPVVNVIA